MEKVEDLFNAIKAGDAEYIEKHLADNGDVDIADENDMTLLMVASRLGEMAIARLLIEQGAKVDRKDISGYTALFNAVMTNNNDVAKLLCQNGADINASDNYKVTPLMWATLCRDPALVKLCLELGADMSLKDIDKRTALCRAKSLGNQEIVDLLKNDYQSKFNEQKKLDSSVFNHSNSDCSIKF